MKHEKTLHCTTLVKICYLDIFEQVHFEYCTVFKVNLHSSKMSK